MQKYRHVINIGIQNTLVYRFNFLFRAAFGLIPLTATIFLWRAVFEGRQDSSTVATYTLTEMISYYLIVTIVDALTAVTDDDWQIAADIREGTISQFLLKPIDYLYYRLCLFFAGRIIYWVLEVSTFIFILFALEYAAGGHLFPLDILPPVISQVLYLTPFPYQMFFPVSVYLGKTTGAASGRG